MKRVTDTRPLLISSVSLWWYPLALLPIAALFYFAFTGALPGLLAPVALFLVVFWIVSFIFAVVAKLTRKPELRQ